MKENAILIKQTGIEKIYVNSDDENGIYAAVGAKRVATIHTVRTQNLSRLLGIHLVGYVNRDFTESNNILACDISGYDFLGSPMLLCKCDDKFNNYPLEENELIRLYIYLTQGKILGDSLDDEEEKLLWENVSEDEDESSNYEDIREEIEDEDMEDLDSILPYVLIIKAKAMWTEIKDSYVDYELAFPLLQYYEEKINVPYFDGMIEIEGIDRINDALDLIIHHDDSHERVKVMLGRETNISFAAGKKETSKRMCDLKFTLEKHRFTLQGRLDGKVKIDELFHFVVKGKEDEHAESMEITDLIVDLSSDDKISDSSCARFTNSGNFYYSWLVDIEAGFVLLTQIIENEEGKKKYYIPVSSNHDVELIESDYNEEYNQYYKVTYRFKIIEE